MAKEKTAAPKADDFDKILDSLEKQFGEGNIFNGNEALLKDKRIMLSAPRLTWAYGGGFKLNGIHRLNGLESSGKTTVATFLAGECQRAKYVETGDWSNCHVVILDNERTFDISHAQDLGLQILNPETGKPLVHVCRNLFVDDQEVAYEKMVISGKVFTTQMLLVWIKHLSVKLVMTICQKQHLVLEQRQTEWLLKDRTISLIDIQLQ